MVDEKTPMADVLAAMSRAEAVACYEFCRRQRAENLRSLADGAQMLGRTAFNLQCERPAELMAWKFPETYDPIPDNILPKALDAAAEGNSDAVYATLKDLDFPTITVIASAASHRFSGPSCASRSTRKAVLNAMQATFAVSPAIDHQFATCWLSVCSVPGSASTISIVRTLTATIRFRRSRM